MYLAEKDGKTFKVSGVQVAAFRKAGYTVTEEKAEQAKTAAKTTSKAKTTRATK
ncbi:MAG: hypothetical protein LUC30_01290 [Clostridiales bacterium]|nr:hypothetical protein [Clostridiales bacterium]